MIESCKISLYQKDTKGCHWNLIIITVSWFFNETPLIIGTVLDEKNKDTYLPNMEYFLLNIPGGKVTLMTSSTRESLVFSVDSFLVKMVVLQNPKKDTK